MKSVKKKKIISIVYNKCIERLFDNEVYLNKLVYKWLNMTPFTMLFNFLNVHKLYIFSIKYSRLKKYSDSSLIVLH